MKKLFKLAIIGGLILSSETAPIGKNHISIKAMSDNVALNSVVFTDISAGTNHNLALDSNGNLWAWGKNGVGQVGNGMTEDVTEPIQIMRGHKFKTISAGHGISAAIDIDGYLYGWGGPNNPTNKQTNVPTLVSSTTLYRNVYCNYNATETSVLSSSIDYFGYSCGYYNGAASYTPTKTLDTYTFERLAYGKTTINVESGIKDIDGYLYIYYYSYSQFFNGAYDFIIINSNGAVSNNHYSNFYNTDSDEHREFFPSTLDLSFFDNICLSKVSIRKENTTSKTPIGAAFFVSETGDLYSVGYNGIYNILGDNSVIGSTYVEVPIKLDTNAKFVDVSGGTNHVLALDDNGKIYSWGDNSYGQLGHGDRKSRTTPTKIMSLDNAKNFSFNALLSETLNGSFEQYGATSYELLTEPSKGIMNVDKATGKFTYTPNAGSFGNDTAVIAIDYGGNSVQYQVNIYIDRKPFIAGGTTSFNVDYGSSYTDSIAAQDPDGDALSYFIDEYPSKGNIELDSSTGKYTYVTKSNAAGSDSFVVAISDGYFTLKLTISVHVESKVQVEDEANIVIDNTKPTSYKGNMNASEIDGDAITYSIIGQPSKGTLSIENDGAYIYTPNEGEYGEDTFTLRATDGKYPNDVTYNVTLYQIKDDNSILTHSITTGSTLNGSIKTISNNCTPTYTISKEPGKGTVTINSSTGEYTYTPNVSTNGLDSFDVLVGYEYGSYKLTINVYQNTSPDISIVETKIVTKENETYHGSIASTDIDTSDVLRYAIVNNPTLGSITVDENTGEYIYYPNKDVAGHDSATLSVIDGINTVLVTLNIKIESSIVTKDTISKTISQNTSLTDTIVASDKDGDDLTYKIITGASNGVASIDEESGIYTYIPNTNFYGNDSFTIEVNDGTSPKTVTVEVFVNRRPVAEQISINLVSNGVSVTSKVNVSDPDGNELSYSLGKTPTQGNVILNYSNGNFAYTPNSDAAGNDTFTIIASDGCDDIIITVTVHNETELVIDDQETNLVVNQGKSTTGQVGTHDADGDSLTYEIKTYPTQGTLLLNQNTGAWTYNASSKAKGSDSFVVTVSDGVDSKDITYNLTINTPATFDLNSTTSITTNQNTSYVGSVSATDADGDSLTYSIVSNGSKGSVTIDPSTGRYIYTPNTGAAGDDSFVIGVNDGNFITEIIINVHIESKVTTNSATQHTTVDKDSVVSGNCDASDADGDTLSYSIYQQGDKGNANVTSDGAWTYFANNGAGADSFIIAITDGNTTTYVTVFVHISSSPTIGESEANITVGEGGSVTGDIDASDEDGDKLTYSVSTSASNGSVSINAISGEYTYAPNSNTTASQDSFIIAVSDGTTTKYIKINVKINNTPNANDAEISINQGGVGKGTIQGTDNENDALTYTIGSQGSHGTVSINSKTGEYTYSINDRNYFGTDTFTVIVSDGYTSTTIVVTINILQNQAPTSSGSSVEVDAGSSVTGNITLTDPEGDTPVYEVTQQGDKGVAYVDSITGEFTYRANYNTEGYDCFIITVSDGFNTRSYLVRVNIHWVDANDSWAIPTTIALGSVTALSLGAAITIMALFLKKRKNIKKGA